MLSFVRRFFEIESVKEDAVDYQSRFLNYKNIVEKSNTSEKIVVVKNLLSIIIEYLNFDEAIQTIETIHDAQDNSSIETIYNMLADRNDVTIDEIICEKIHFCVSGNVWRFVARQRQVKAGLRLRLRQQKANIIRFVKARTYGRFLKNIKGFRPKILNGRTI